MKVGFYSVFFTGEAGASMALLAVNKDKVLGFDAVGGRWEGTFYRRAEWITFKIDIGLLKNSDLATTGKTIEHDQKIGVIFECKAEEFTRRDHIVTLPIGEVIARFAFLGPFDDILTASVETD